LAFLSETLLCLFHSVMGDLEEHLAQCGWISLRLKASLSKAEFTIEK